MPSIPPIHSFEAWRSAARSLAAADVRPEEVVWITPHDTSLFPSSDAPLPHCSRALRVPKPFLDAARTVSCHRDPARFALLYRILYRLTHNEPHLLDITVDDDIHPFLMMEKAVRRDAHKMKAFVRFREAPPGSPENFIAFHRPDHPVLPLVADFFTDRFHDLSWRIITPDASLAWNTRTLHWLPGDGPSAAPQDDAMESFWKTYYATTFNPARVRLRAMTREMPKRYWTHLPEADVINPLVRAARTRVDAMVDHTTGVLTAHDFLPPAAREGRRVPLDQLREAAVRCQGCTLCERATQTVFGEPPTEVGGAVGGDTRIMLIGEQPGDHEDLQGRPFLGPAGQLLMHTLASAGLRRDSLYLTNAVKHFKWTPDQRGKRRIHKTPAYTEVAACRPWLLAELASFNPTHIVTLGATAARSLLGPTFRLTPNLNRWLTHENRLVLPLLHPAALLRMPEGPTRTAALADFTTAFHDLAARTRPSP